MNPDPEIAKIQTDWLESYRLSQRWIIVAEPAGGYSVHVHTIDGVAPSSTYPSREQAAARLLQMLEIKEPVTPQDWPERVCIGTVGQSGEDTTDE